MDAPSPSRPVYLDGHSTTPVDSRVAAAMWPWFTEKFGNAASTSHAYGWEAAAAVERAREQIARLIAADPRELVFTSGATESNNLAIKGVIRLAPAGSRLVVSAAEHRAVLDPAKRLRREGFDVVTVPVNRYGQPEPDAISAALSPTTALVSIMLANNEVGTISPIDQIGAICRARKIWLHCDAAQAVGRIPVDLRQLPVDLLSLSGHKLYAPKGIGVLYIRRGDRRIPIEPLFDGGGHEQRLRSGTLPVPLIVALGAACELSAGLLPQEAIELAALRDRLWLGLRQRLDGLVLNGHLTCRLPGNLHVSFEGVSGEALLAQLKLIAVSSGSACTSADPEPSHVLRAMGVRDELAMASLRFGIGRFNTADEIDFAAEYVAETVRRLRR